MLKQKNSPFPPSSYAEAAIASSTVYGLTLFGAYADSTGWLVKHFLKENRAENVPDKTQIRAK